jgi:hypothetical protein
VCTLIITVAKVALLNGFRLYMIMSVKLLEYGFLLCRCRGNPVKGLSALYLALLEVYWLL